MFGGEIIDDLDVRLDLAREVLRMENPATFFEDACNRDKYNISLLFGYIRCFVRLAYVGDVSVVAKDLGITRQTVTRQLFELENLLETDLFDSIGSRSSLTDRGLLWLPRAQEVFDLANAFQSRRGNNEADYQSTQLPLRMLFRDENSPQILKDFVTAWMHGEKLLECPRIGQFNDHMIVYERRNGIWYSRSIGQKSSFFSWYGEDQAKKSTNTTVSDMAGSGDLWDEVSFLLDGVYTRGGVHFSEVSCCLRKPDRTERQPVLYQRVLVELEDEDRRPVIGSVIEVLHQSPVGQELSQPA